MTNLKMDEKWSTNRSDSLGYRSSMNIRTREKPLFPTLIYSPKMSQNPNRHKISTVRSTISNDPYRLTSKKTPHKCTSPAQASSPVTLPIITPPTGSQFSDSLVVPALESGDNCTSTTGRLSESVSTWTKQPPKPVRRPRDET